MQARRTVLLMAAVFLFLSLGGFFQLSLLRLTLHHVEQRSVSGTAADCVLRLSEKRFHELLQGRDEIRIGTCWYDVSSVVIRKGQVTVRLHRDTGESYWRELLVHASGKTQEKKLPVNFLFYYLSCPHTLSGHAPIVEQVSGLPEPSVPPTAVAGIFRPPGDFSAVC